MRILKGRGRKVAPFNFFRALKKSYLSQIEIWAKDHKDSLEALAFLIRWIEV